MAGMPSKASLAALFRDHGQRWEIERLEPGSQWVACTRDGQAVQIIAARDIAGLRYHIEAAERAETQPPPAAG